MGVYVNAVPAPAKLELLLRLPLAPTSLSNQPCSPPLPPPLLPAVDATSVRFIRNTPGLVPTADRHSLKLRNTQVIERRLVQAIVAQGSPLAGAWVFFGGGGSGAAERAHLVQPSRQGSLQQSCCCVLCLDGAGGLWDLCCWLGLSLQPFRSLCLRGAWHALLT